MRVSLIVQFTIFISLAGALSNVRAQCGEHSDLLIGRTGAGQLVLQNAEFSLDQVVLLCPVNGVLSGYSNGNPGFDAEEVVDDPGNDFFTLESGAVVSIEAVSLAPAFKAWGPGLATLMDEAGESILLGDEGLHEHLTWHADSNDPSFDPSQTHWVAQFKLVDTGSTGYAESDVFELQFNNGLAVPAVSEWGIVLMVCGLLVAGTLAMRRTEVA